MKLVVGRFEVSTSKIPWPKYSCPKVVELILTIIQCSLSLEDLFSNACNASPCNLISRRPRRYILDAMAYEVSYANSVEESCKVLIKTGFS